MVSVLFSSPNLFLKPLCSFISLELGLKLSLSPTLRAPACLGQQPAKTFDFLDGFFGADRSML